MAKGTDPEKRSQCEMILKYLQDFGSITPIDALREFGCMRLSARISDLKLKGVPIRSERCKSLGKYGNIVSYSRYVLEDGNA